MRLQDDYETAERVFQARQRLSRAGCAYAPHLPPKPADVDRHRVVLVDQLQSILAGRHGALARRQLPENVLVFERGMPDDALREKRLHGSDSLVRLRLLEQCGRVLDVCDVLRQDAMILDGLLKRLDLFQ